jgi:hypothetical protein
MCTVLLLQAVNPIAVNSYIIYIVVVIIIIIIIEVVSGYARSLDQVPTGR